MWCKPLLLLASRSGGGAVDGRPNNKAGDLEDEDVEPPGPNKAFANRAISFER